MLGPWYFSTSEWHRRGQENIAAESLELEAASESLSPELCFRATPAACPRFPGWGGARAAVAHTNLCVMENFKHTRSKQKC